MTLTDVYCRFNRARGMQVCISSVSVWSFLLHKENIRHATYDFHAVLSFTSLLRVMHALGSFYFDFIYLRNVIFVNRNIRSFSSWSLLTI